MLLGVAALLGGIAAPGNVVEIQNTCEGFAAFVVAGVGHPWSKVQQEREPLPKKHTHEVLKYMVCTSIHRYRCCMTFFLKRVVRPLPSSLLL